MEEKEKVLVVAILDESGSMEPFVNDTINGYNGFIRERFKENNTRVTTVLFNNQARRIFYRVDPEEALLKPGIYRPCGGTALLDAVGEAITDTVESLLVGLERRYKKVIFLIITDGEENASSHYSHRDVKRLIESTKEKYGFEYLFMGANIDVFKEAENLGINRNQTIRFKASQSGIKRMYENVNACYSACIEKDDVPEKDETK